MDLVGGWIRRLLGAGIVAALVPLAMLAALVVIVAGSGGVGGLGSLRQLVTGPEISTANGVAAGKSPERSRELALVAPRTIVASVPQSAQPSGGSRRDAGDGGTRPPARRQPLSPPVVELPPVAAVPPPPAVAAPPAAPAPTPGSAEQVVNGVAETVDDVVGVVGEVIGGVGETLGGILGGPPPRR